VEHFVVSEVSRHGYLAVFALMILESACVPIPSEAVMLFGGALAGGLVLGEVHVELNLVTVAVASTKVGPSSGRGWIGPAVDSLTAGRLCLIP
jgi:membrane protein DedA with SNARE-associated domain